MDKYHEVVRQLEAQGGSLEPLVSDGLVTPSGGARSDAWSEWLPAEGEPMSETF